MSKDNLPRAAELSEKAKGKRPMVSKVLAPVVANNDPSASNRGTESTAAGRRGVLLDTLLDLAMSSDPAVETDPSVMVTPNPSPEVARTDEGM